MCRFRKLCASSNRAALTWASLSNWPLYHCEPKALSANELQQRIQQAVWSDANVSPEQAAWQRNLQREYVNRLTMSLLRGGSLRADTRAAIREQAKATLAQLKGTRKGPKGDKSDAAAWQAHRQDCIETLERALQASVIRVTP